jgi:hypothetical protein
MASTSFASLDKTSALTNTDRRADDSGGVGEVSHPSSTSLSLDKMSTSKAQAMLLCLIYSIRSRL